MNYPHFPAGFVEAMQEAQRPGRSIGEVLQRPGSFKTGEDWKHKRRKNCSYNNLGGGWCCAHESGVSRGLGEGGGGGGAAAVGGMHGHT